MFSLYGGVTVCIIDFQALGVGKLRPNTVVLGYKTDWQKSDPRDVLDYFNVIQYAALFPI